MVSRGQSQFRDFRVKGCRGLGVQGWGEGLGFRLGNFGSLGVEGLRG